MISGGKAKLVVRHPTDSLSMKIPRAWTDADGAPPPPSAAPDTKLTVEALRELMHLVDTLGEGG